METMDVGRMFDGTIADSRSAKARTRQDTGCRGSEIRAGHRYWRTEEKSRTLALGAAGLVCGDFLAFRGFI